MRKYLIMAAAAFALGTTTANELPFQGEFSILSGGMVVGSGELEDGKLKITLPEGTAGFDGTLVVVGEDGLPVEYEVTLGADGSILLWNTLTDLTSEIIAAGGEVEVDYETVEVEEESEEEDTESTDGVEGSEEEDEGGAVHARGLDRAREKAADQAQDALERAADQVEREADEAEEAAEQAAEDAEEAAERAAEEAEEAAERTADAAEKASERGNGDAEDDEDEDEDEVEVEEEEEAEEEDEG